MGTLPGMRFARWHGTPEEFKLLQKIVQAYCSCEHNAQAARASACGSHGLLGKQESLDRLLFVRRMRERFRAPEFTTNGGVTRPATAESLD